VAAQPMFCPWSVTITSLLPTQVFDQVCVFDRWTTNTRGPTPPVTETYRRIAGTRAAHVEAVVVRKHLRRW
jgi:hypothetical protein